MIAWFTRNSVAANLLMISIFVGGLLVLNSNIPLEVFPSIESNTVSVTVPYRGANPSEVEESVIIKIEEEIQDLEGIEEITSNAFEGSGRVTIEVLDGYEPRDLLDDIKNRVDSINTFPGETERPVFSINQIRREVIAVTIAGEVSEKALRQLGEEVRDDLTSMPNISQVDLKDVRPYEISIELSEDNMRRYGLSFQDVRTAINQSSLDLSAGTIKSNEGEILLRTKAQAYTAQDYGKIVILKQSNGSRVLLKDIANINDGFEETPVNARFNGKPAVLLEIYTIGNQNAIELAETVIQYIDEKQADMPDGVELSYWRDRATKIIKKRIDTLTQSAMQGGILVVLLLTLFLRPSVAIWVSLGIPISFMGAVIFMPVFGVTINVVSVFAFILVLGIVVDDAIVTGENIYRRLRENGKDKCIDTTIAATEEVAVPVTFGVLTTIVAFCPLLMLDSGIGKWFQQIPYIVIPVLIFSLIESKFILPAHLKHTKTSTSESNALMRIQAKIANSLEIFVDKIYRPVLNICLHNRYTTLAIFVATIIIIFTALKSGHITFRAFPKIQSEIATASLKMPLGYPFEKTDQNIQLITQAAIKLQDKYIDPETKESIITSVLSTAGSSGGTRGQSHIGRVQFEIVAPEERSLQVSSFDLVKEWRQLIGTMPDVKELTFRAQIGRSSNPIEYQFQGQDFAQLKALSERVKAKLAEYDGIFDITDSFDEGKKELTLKLKPNAENLGLSLSDLAQQVRAGFFGAEVQRIQRGRDDVRVMLRYPRDQRNSSFDLDQIFVRSPAGQEVPFSEVAEVTVGQGYATITRVNRQRIINVIADIDANRVDLTSVNEEMKSYIDSIIKEFPRTSFSFEGEAKESRETNESTMNGMLVTLIAIYILLAIPLKSYVQPFVVMSIIPFGVVGAVLGHLIMGKAISFMSLFGLLALLGVMVNDSLVMVDYVNKKRAEGQDLPSAVRTAGAARFRAIILTSITTFVGLMPLIFEKSTQAQFLIPMAISLGFGVLYATFITLLLIPVNTLILDDLSRFTRKLKAKVWDL